MAFKPKNTDAAKAMIALVGTPYSRLDCQAAIEQAVKNCGGEMDYSGSNAMARDTLYLIPIEQAIQQGLQPGDALFIREADGGEPDKYKRDGLGNFNHVAMYVGENALTDTDKDGKVRACNAVHSSKTVGRVAGTTVKNGYTHAGRFDQIGYGGDADYAEDSAPTLSDVETVEGNTPEAPKPYAPAAPGAGEAIVNTEEGELLLRKKASRTGTVIDGMPKGTIVKVLEQYGSEWTMVQFYSEKGTRHEGWCMTKYLLFG